jgi:glycosyltransferase involved in cell wall biosynthesis
MCPSVVCCAEIGDPQWRWLEENLSETGLTFAFARCVPRSSFEAKIPIVNWARFRGCYEAVQMARHSGAKVLVTHGPTLAAWCGIFARVYRLGIPIVAHSFNFTELPNRLKRPLFARALSRISLFVVFSSIERDLYSQAFGLSADRFNVIRWGVRPPYVDSPEIPLQTGDYVCAIGSNARDYRTLIEAARRMPDIHFVLVVRPDSLLGLSLPDNCTIYTNLPLGKAMNVLHHSRFMALPLSSSDVPCGHVTMVAAMHLGKAFVITESTGVREYARNAENALTVPPRSVGDFVQAMRRLWEDPSLCARLGQNGQRFARSECSEARVVEHFRGWLHAEGVLEQCAEPATAVVSSAHMK